MRARFNYNSVYRDTLTDAILFGSLNGMIRFTSRESYSDRTPKFDAEKLKAIFNKEIK